jgi:hypothetical protein
VLWGYSKDLQEKKGHTENRKVIEILQAFLDTMIPYKLGDLGGPNQFWHPGELNDWNYHAINPIKVKKEIITAILPESLLEFSNESIEELPIAVRSKYEALRGGLAANIWRYGLFEAGKDEGGFMTYLGFLKTEGLSSVNMRWISNYRRKIVETFFADNTTYLDELLMINRRKAAPKDTRVFMWNAFHTRNKNRAYSLKLGSHIKSSSPTLTAYVLLISDFVFSKETMKTMSVLLGRHFSCHPLFSDKFLKTNLETKALLPKLKSPYIPLHDHPRPNWRENDMAFITETFLYPKSILAERLIDYILSGEGNSSFKSYMFHDRAHYMIAAQWLNILNLLGYKAYPTAYLRKCFPKLEAKLIDTPAGTKHSNMAMLAEALAEFVFGPESIFEISKDDRAKWKKYAVPLPKDTPVKGVLENWVFSPWLNLSFKDHGSHIDEEHPFYQLRKRDHFTITNIVEWLFFGKMWWHPIYGEATVIYNDSSNYQFATYGFHDDAFGAVAVVAEEMEESVEDDEESDDEEDREEKSG